MSKLKLDSKVVYVANGEKNADDWDDSLIMDIFRESIQSYNKDSDQTSLKTLSKKRKHNHNSNNNSSSKMDSSKRTVITKEDMLNQAKAGDWQPVIIPLKISSSMTSNEDIEPGEIIDEDGEYDDDNNIDGDEGKISDWKQNVQNKDQDEDQDENDDDTLTNENSELNNALNEMLRLWYQTGYATGRYHTLLEQQQQNNHNRRKKG